VRRADFAFRQCRTREGGPDLAFKDRAALLGKEIARLGERFEKLIDEAFKLLLRRRRRAVRAADVSSGTDRPEA
jgi:hypothetical protein